jgi:hypothetical protein
MRRHDRAARSRQSAVFFHDDEAGALKVLDKPLGDDPRHDLGGVVNALAPAVEQREREGVGEVFGVVGVRRFGAPSFALPANMW